MRKEKHMKQKQYTFSKTRFRHMRHMGVILFLLSCFSVSNLCCHTTTNVTNNNSSPLFIEDFASSVPTQSLFESDTYAWYQEDVTAEPITLPTSNKLTISNAPKGWRVCTDDSKLFLHMDDYCFYINSEDPHYLYQQFDLATGKYIGPFLKRNVDYLSFSLEKIRTPSQTSFTPPLTGYAYNEDHEYEKGQWKIIAIEKTEDQQTTLWEHEVPHSGVWPENYTDWGGLIQYDDVLIYTAYTLNYKKRTAKNFITRALSKDTGEVLWEVKNPVEGGHFCFPEKSNSRILNQIGKYYYKQSEGSSTSDIGESTLYLINTDTGKMEGQIIDAGYYLDSEGHLLSFYDQKEYLVTTNLDALEKVSTGWHDNTGKRIIDSTEDSFLLSPYSSTSLAAYDRKTLHKIWEIENATGYSDIQPDDTMVVILSNQYICHINVNDGLVLKYRDTKKLLGERCTCTNLSRDDQIYTTKVRISPNKLAIVFIKESTPISLDTIEHKQKILALSLHTSKKK